MLIAALFSGCHRRPPAPAPAVRCLNTFQWTNPTEDVNDKPLKPDELITATMYVWRPPLTLPGDTIIAINGEISPYSLMWQDAVGKGTLWYRLTVSNAAGESEYSNEVAKSCGG